MRMVTAMREIKFRGLRADDFWVYGDFYTVHEKDWAVIRNIATNERFYVYPDTVGQFTGMYDAEGREIYEGDVVRYENCICLVVYNSTRFASFALRKDGWAFDHYFGEAFEASECQVIGNVHDNPNLLEVDDARD